MYPRYKERVSTKKYQKSNGKGHGWGWQIINNHGTVVAKSWPTLYSSAANARRGAADTAEVMRRWAISNGYMEASTPALSKPEPVAEDRRVVVADGAPALATYRVKNEIDDPELVFAPVSKQPIATPKRNRLSRFLRTNK